MFALDPEWPGVEDAGHPELTGLLAAPEVYPLSKLKTESPALHGLLFLRADIAVASNASVQRSPGCAADIFARKRAKLSVLHFEYQLLLKCNYP